MVELTDPESSQNMVVDADAARRDYVAGVDDFREHYRHICQQAGIDYENFDTSMPFDAALMEYLIIVSSESGAHAHSSSSTIDTMGLSFLNIMLLSGMAVIAIPVLLHLLCDENLFLTNFRRFGFCKPGRK